VKAEACPSKTRASATVAPALRSSVMQVSRSAGGWRSSSGSSAAARTRRSTSATTLCPQRQSTRVYEWMRAEHADVWLGFREDQVAGFFDAARLQHHGYAALGMQ
jgi:hypothetical protein